MDRDWRVRWSVLPLFEEGKDIEVRVKNGYPERVCKGDVLFINERYVRTVVEVRTYADFKAMLVKEDYRRMNPRAKDSAEVLSMLRKMYTPEHERRGVLAFELRKP